MIQVLERFHVMLGRASRAAGNGVTLSDLAGAAGISPQTALHIVKTMAALGYLDCDAATKTYRVGMLPGLFAGQESLVGRLKQAAENELKALAESTGEMVLLAVRVGEGREVLLQWESRHALVLRAEANRIPELHTTPTGLVLLAARSEKERAEYVKRMKAPDFLKVPLRPELRSAAAFSKRLIEIREAAECFLFPEAGDVDGVAVLAFGVRMNAGVVAAIGMKIPAHRFPEKKRQAILNEGRAAAEKIGAELERDLKRLKA